MMSSSTWSSAAWSSCQSRTKVSETCRLPRLALQEAAAVVKLIKKWKGQQQTNCHRCRQPCRMTHAAVWPRQCTDGHLCQDSDSKANMLQLCHSLRTLSFACTPTASCALLALTGHPVRCLQPSALTKYAVSCLRPSGLTQHPVPCLRPTARTQYPVSCLQRFFRTCWACCTACASTIR